MILFDKGNIIEGVLSPATAIINSENVGARAPNATNFDNCFEGERQREKENMNKGAEHLIQH